MAGAVVYSQHGENEEPQESQGTSVEYADVPGMIQFVLIFAHKLSSFWSDLLFQLRDSSELMFFQRTTTV